MNADTPPTLRAVAERSPVALCLLRNGRITYANPATARLFDAAPADLDGRRFADLVAPGDRDRLGDALFRARTETAAVRFAVHRPEATGAERRLVDSDWCALDECGDDRLVGALREVTERVDRRERLERDREMLESLLSNLPVSVYFKDRRSRHERVSEHMVCPAEDSYVTNTEGKRHCHPEDVLGKTDFDLYEPALAEVGIRQDRAVMRSEEPLFDEIAESTTNLGETIYTSTTKAPRYDDDGNVIGVVGITMDVTERIADERELERQNRRLEEFTEVLSHDLRNPLGVAEGHAELLADECSDPRLQKIRESLERMSALITEIRSFVLEGRTVESPAAIDLPSAAREAWSSVETDEAALRVSATHRIRADPERLRRLLENLYRNAIEHAEGAVTVTVGDLERGFYVADDGPGVPDEEKEKIFERGYTTSADGTGFGLAIVRNIAEAHDWSVEVADAPEGGARFEFTGVVRVQADADEHL